MYCKLIILVLLICIIYVSYLISSNNIEGFNTTCQGTRWNDDYNAGYGSCETYVEGSGTGNHGYCQFDIKDNLTANDVCHECGVCSAPTSSAASDATGNDPTSTSSGVTGNDPTSTSTGGNNGFTSDVCSKDTINNNIYQAMQININFGYTTRNFFKK